MGRWVNSYDYGNAHLKETARDVYRRWDAPPSAPSGGGGWDAMPPEMSLGLWEGCDGNPVD